MKTFALLGFFPIKSALITVVRALDLQDAAHKLRGTIIPREFIVREDVLRQYEETVRSVARCRDVSSWEAFRPSGDIAKPRREPHDAKCVVNPTARVIAQARRGPSHDPFDGHDFENREYTDDHEAVQLKLFDHFVLCEVPCVL